MGGRGSNGKKYTEVTYYGKKVKVYTNPPNGYIKSETGSLIGLDLYHNNKSRFSGDRKYIYVKTDKTKSISALIKENIKRNEKKAKSIEEAIANRYSGPQQQSASSKRYQNSLMNRLKDYL